MGTLMLAVALLVQPADFVTVTGVVVDPAGKPVSDVEVLVAGRRPADESVPTLARTMTDDHGAFRLQFDRQRLRGIGPIRVSWAYRPGRLIAQELADLTGNGAIPPVRLTLAAPLKRTMTILDPEGRPLAGVRLAPVLYRGNDRGVFFTPDDWRERFTVATDPDGVATLPYLPATIDPQRVRVTAPGIVPHTFPLPDRPGNDRFTLKLGRPARLAGAVTNDAGQPAANVPVEVWVENLYYPPSNPDGDPKPAGMPSLIPFDSGPIRTGADGSFLTPPQLMTGSSYRIVIRPEGDAPVSSESLPARTALTTVPPLRLQQRRKLIGLVHDRQGQPVAAARVLLPSGAPSTKTDAQGRFVLEGILPDRTYLLIQAEGFRLQGWPAIPARQPAERTLILVRSSEPPDRTMAPLPAPISPEESRALARRVLDPFLRATLEKGDNDTKIYSIRTLSKIDPSEALELLEKQALQDSSLADDVRMIVAAERMADDPVEAVSIVEAIATPMNRGLGYQRLAAALPASERDRKRTLLERATLRLHEGAADPESRIYVLGQIAESWLSLGEVEKARTLVVEGIKSLEAAPPAQRWLNEYFLETAARLELDRVLSLVKDTTNPRGPQSHASLAAIAVSLANDHPAQAERVFQLFDQEPPTRLSARERTGLVLHLSRRMARTDPEWMRRIIAGLKDPGEQACAWALLAAGLADRDKPASRSALTESIRVIDRLLDSAGAAERSPQPSIAINPAASILPIVESVAPERVEEVFWRAVAHMPKNDATRGLALGDRRVALPAIFLARYDHQVAAALSTQIDQVLRTPPRGLRGHLLYDIWAKAAIDPRGAVAIIEALPPGGADSDHPTNRDRIELATWLAESAEAPWKRVWRDFGVDFE
jgi:hypothetical protein